MKKNVSFLVLLGFVFSFVSVVSGSGWTDNLNEDLVHYWDMESATDRVGDSDLLIGEGPIDYTPLNCLIGNCGQFDVNRNLDIPNGAVDFQDSYTFNLWVRADNVGQDLLFFSANPNGHLGIDSAKWYVENQYAGGANYNPESPVPLYEHWHMMTITQDNQADHNVRIYIDGNLEHGGNTGSLTPNRRFLGRYQSGSSELVGQMDEISYWERTLNSTEIEQLYNDGAGITHDPSPNTPPIIEPIENISVSEGEVIVVEVNASDMNEEDNLSYNITPEGFFEQEGNVFTWMSDFEDSGVYDFEVSVSDGEFEVFEEFGVEVMNVNRAPELLIEDVVVDEGELVEFLIYVDADNENGVENDDNEITVIIDGVPEGSEIIDGDVFSWRPSFYQAGEYDMAFFVSDGEFEVSGNMTIEVLQVDSTDLTLSSEDIIFSDDEPFINETIYITAIFYNLLEVNPEVIRVDFYDGHPDNGSLIGTDIVTTEENANDSYFAQVPWDTVFGEHDIYVVLDPENEIEEGDETNNVAFRPITVRILPDMMIRAQDIGFTNPFPDDGEEINILAMVHNLNLAQTGPFNVLFYLDYINSNNVIATEVLDLGPDSTQLLIVPWIAEGGEHEIHVVVDSENEVEETNEENNVASKEITVTHVNHPPILTEIGDRNVSVDELLIIELSAFDEDEDTLLFDTDANLVLPSKAKFDPTRGLMLWAPNEEDVGEYNVTFFVSDGVESDEEIITISVFDPNL